MSGSGLTQGDPSCRFSPRIIILKTTAIFAGTCVPPFDSLHNVNFTRGYAMRHTIKLTLMLGIAAGALTMVSGYRGYTQAIDPNAAPNPYSMQENWAQLPADRIFGAVIKVQVDRSDGKSIWVFDRCAARECTNSMLPPLLKFDSSGKFVKAIGAGMFAIPHGLYVGRDGNVWAGDEIARNGKGADLIKFSPDGMVLMTLGKSGMPGNGPDYLSAASSVVVAPISKDGKFITAWGTHGKAAGEIDTPHGIALDWAGRVYVADRANNRIQIFEPDGKFVAEWKDFGRPSDVAIDKNDMIYVNDTQSTDKTNPAFQNGIRIGSVKDGKVTAFIPQTDPSIGAPEGLTADDEGNIYASYTNKFAVRRFVKK